MKKLHFTSSEQFEVLFKKKTTEVTDAIVEGIEKAVAGRKKSADLFEITFDGIEMMYEIALPQAEWENALQSCLDYYHDLNKTDECIDTWKLLEIVKTF